MRLLLVTFLILGGAALATEYALLNVHRMQEEKKEGGAQTAPPRTPTRYQVKPLIPGGGHSAPRQERVTSKQVSDLVDLYRRDPGRAAGLLGEAGTAEAARAIGRLYDGEMLPERRIRLLEAAAESDAGRPLLFEVARGSGPEARRARQLLQASASR
jgi:hypothetical protein